MSLEGNMTNGHRPSRLWVDGHASDRTGVLFGGTQGFVLGTILSQNILVTSVTSTTSLPMNALSTALYKLCIWHRNPPTRSQYSAWVVQQMANGVQCQQMFYNVYPLWQDVLQAYVHHWWVSTHNCTVPTIPRSWTKWHPWLVPHIHNITSNKILGFLWRNLFKCPRTLKSKPNSDS